MSNSQIYVYFKSIPPITYLILKFISFFKLLGFEKARFEKNRVILTTKMDRVLKMKSIRHLFKFYNILNIQRVETDY